MSQGFFQTPVLVVRFTLEILSSICYIICIYLCFRYKIYRLLSVNLFIAQCAFQLLFIFVPFMLVPVFAVENMSPLKPGYIENYYCTIYAVLFNLGWLLITFISVWMAYYVYRMIRGQKENKKRFYRSISLLLIPFTIFQLIAYYTDGYQEFYWSYGGEEYYVVCSCGDRYFIILEWTIEVIAWGLWIVVFCMIKCEKDKLQQIGIKWEDQINNIQIFGCVQLGLWSINLFVKWMDNDDHYHGGNFGIGWQILNLVYDLEGIFVLVIFLQQYKQHMTLNLCFHRFIDNIWKYSCCCLNLCHWQNRYRIQRIYSDDSDDYGFYKEKNISLTM